MTEFGVKWRMANGYEYVNPYSTKHAAERAVELCGGAGYSPRAIEVMSRPVGEWVVAAFTGHDRRTA